MLLAAHQPNFMPWLPFFEKVHKADIFVILTEVQYTNNSWINRCQVNGKWWTNPIAHGLVPIIDKYYTSGQSLLNLNMLWIYAIANLLTIDIKKIKFDFPTEKKGTERIIEICKKYGANEYLTNPDATKAYLDEKLLNDNGIKLVPFVSKNKKHVFEYFNEIGIEKTRNLLHEPEGGKEVKERSKTSGHDSSKSGSLQHAESQTAK